VVFYVDPDIVDQPELKDIRTITLSYTLFPADEPAKPVAAETTTGNKTTRDQLGG